MFLNRMYLRPGNLYVEFMVPKSGTEVTSTGRVKPSYSALECEKFKGVLCEADARDKLRFEQIQHPITHTIVQKGKPVASPEDKLILGDRRFIVKSVDEPGSLGVCTLYYAEERFDIL